MVKDDILFFVVVVAQERYVASLMPLQRSISPWKVRNGRF